MPKKKIQHKGQPKHATEESDESVFRKNSETTEEEYTTVTDFETNKKYSKRLIESNWSKYEANLSDFDCGDERNELPKTDDFNSLLKTASSDCSHFQFSSEKLWKNENNIVSASKIFDLDVNILSSGLACVPFYERLGLDENELSAEDKEKFDKAAENSWKLYNSIREKLVNKPEDSKMKNSDSNLQTLEDSFKVKLDLARYGEANESNSSGIQETNTTTSSKEVEISNQNESRDKKIGKPKQKIFYSENDNLEDWLDSVLDD